MARTQEFFRLLWGERTRGVAMIDFWTRLDDLVASHSVVIDRPKGTAHPRYPDMIYPLDYGYVEDTSGGDGNGIDVWRGSRETKRLVAVICTVDSLKNDTEVKLLLGCSDEEIEIVNRFHNDSTYMSGRVVRRDPNEG